MRFSDSFDSFDGPGGNLGPEWKPQPIPETQQLECIGGPLDGEFRECDGIELHIALWQPPNVMTSHYLPEPRMPGLRRGVYRRARVPTRNGEALVLLWVDEFKS